MTEINIQEIRKYFCEKYPNAVQVTLSIGFHGVKVAVENYVIQDFSHFSTRTLGGGWIEGKGGIKND